MEELEARKTELLNKAMAAPRNQVEYIMECLSKASAYSEVITKMKE